MTEPTPGKYSKGIHIKMLPDGRLDNGVELMRDVAPIIEDLKGKWREKLHLNTQEKDKVNEELVQNEIEKRNLTEEIKRLHE